MRTSGGCFKLPRYSRRACIRACPPGAYIPVTTMAAMSADPTRLPPPPPPSRDWALFLDVDGTLLDLAPTPDAVYVPPGLVEDLGRMHDALGGAIALVSGRRIETLDVLFTPLRLPTIGLHGLQTREGPVVAHEQSTDRAAVLSAATALVA